MPNVFDYVRLFMFLIGTCVLATRKTKVWFLVDILWFSMIMGISIILGIPSPAGMFSSKLDDMHLHMLKAIGCYIILPATLWFQCRKSHDSNVMKSIMLCRIMSLGVCTLLDVINSIRFPKSFTGMHTYYTLGFGVLWLVASAIHLIRHGLPTLRREHKMPINLYLKIDLAVTAVIGCLDIFIPRIIFNTTMKSMKANDIHDHFLQMFGTYLLASCILSYLALGFRDNSDKKAVIISKTVINPIVYLFYIFACLKGTLTPSNPEMIISFVMFPVIMLPAVGLYIHRDHRSSISIEGYNLRSRKD